MSLDADVRRLAGVRPFDALPREALQLIAFSCEKRALKAGEPLFSAGDAAEGAYFVLEGEIVLRRGDQERRAHVGALIGEQALLAQTQRPADASAAMDSLLLSIPSATFRRVLTEFPQVAARLRRVAAQRARSQIARLERIHRRALSSRS